MIISRHADSSKTLSPTSPPRSGHRMKKRLEITTVSGTPSAGGGRPGRSVPETSPGTACRTAGTGTVSATVIVVQWLAIAALTIVVLGVLRQMASLLERAAAGPRVVAVPDAECARVLGIPGRPFAMAVNADGVITAKQPVNTLAQLTDMATSAWSLDGVP